MLKLIIILTLMLATLLSGVFGKEEHSLSDDPLPGGEQAVVAEATPAQTLISTPAPMKQTADSSIDRDENETGEAPIDMIENIVSTPAPAPKPTAAHESTASQGDNNETGMMTDF